MAVGREIAITRGRYPWENAGRELTPDDVHAILRENRSFELATVGGNVPGLRWKEHPGGEDVVLWLLDGNLVARNPDRATLALMADLAGSIGARVVGEHGEIFNRDGRWSHPEAETESPPERASRRSFFRSLTGRSRESGRAAGARLTGVPLHEGDRVRDAWGRIGTVTGIEFVNGGALDIVTVRYPDGREVRRSLVAHGFERVD